MPKKSTKKEKKLPKVEPHTGVINYKHETLKEGQGLHHSKFGPTTAVANKFNGFLHGEDRARAKANLKPLHPKKQDQSSIKNYTIVKKDHPVDKLMAGRFNKKGKDIHTHSFAISHGHGNKPVKHYQERMIRMYRSKYYQPSITQEQYNNRTINYLPDPDRNNYMPIVNTPLSLQNLGQGPLS